MHVCVCAWVCMLMLVCSLCTDNLARVCVTIICFIPGDILRSASPYKKIIINNKQICIIFSTGLMNQER